MMGQVSPSHGIPAAAPSVAPTLPSLMLIHGTVLPTTQANRPTWSVAGSGPLFLYLQNIRPDIYNQADYFKWEGGYTDYAREVAADNLTVWLQLRGLNGIDIVAHSHGCNVLMELTKSGSRFGKIVLLSCPVHWNKYSIQPLSYTSAQLVRIHYDLVILVDHGAQRFPPGTIPETILPRWFYHHSDTTTPNVWQQENLHRFL